LRDYLAGVAQRYDEAYAVIEAVERQGSV
jgi:hypothetical protein